MKGYKTHMTRAVDVNRTWLVRGKKRTEVHVEDMKVCSGEVIQRPSFWMFEKKILAKRWNKVNCKACLNMRRKNDGKSKRNM